MFSGIFNAFTWTRPRAYTTISEKHQLVIALVLFSVFLFNDTQAPLCFLFRAKKDELVSFLVKEHEIMKDFFFLVSFCRRRFHFIFPKYVLFCAQSELQEMSLVRACVVLALANVQQTYRQQQIKVRSLRFEVCDRGSFPPHQNRRKPGTGRDQIPPGSVVNLSKQYQIQNLTGLASF